MCLGVPGPVFEPVETAPLAPLGSHSVFAGVDQNKVVTTIRMTEVAADPTNQLALEAAVRRRRKLVSDPRSTEDVRLCAVERVTRAQVFEGARSFAHCSLVGAVVSGRGRSGHGFEVTSLTDLLVGLSGVAAEATTGPVRIELTDFDGSFGDALARVADRVSTKRVACVVDGDRQTGRSYYTGEEMVEVGDGGFVDCAAALLQSRKERLLIGGVSLERLAMI